MGGIGGLLGVNGGAGGSGFSGPSSTNLINPTDPTQVKDAYSGVQDAQAKQGALLAAIQAQNGLANQNQVYNQLQGVANGTGPNPAQAMLNQATGQNVERQSAMMAGQRGASSNVGLMARQAAQQGADTQQQAIQQGAALQANQSLNAINSAGSMANTQASNQISQTNANTAAQQAEQGNLMNAYTSYNNAAVGMQGNVNNVNGQLANTNMQGSQSMIGGLMNGSAISGMLANGGEVSAPNRIQKPVMAMADGGPVSMFGQSVSASSGPTVATPSFTSNSAADDLKKGAQNLTKKTQPSIKPGAATTTTGGDTNTMSNMAANGGIAQGGKVPVLLSPGERALPPKEVQKVAEGKKNPMEAGKKIPGKPKVGGDKNSYANDTYSTTAEEGTIILPRSVTQAKDAGKKAKAFVEAILAKKASEGKK